jgi:nucleoside-diphosphate-sugar epimerase
MRNKIISEDVARIASRRIGWDVFSGKTVLVAGASGFLPAYMVEVLLELNENILARPVTVIALVRNQQAAEVRFKHHKNSLSLRILQADVAEDFSVEGPIDVIVHAASPASPKFYGSDPVGTLKANVLGTHRLLELARDKRSAGFLFFSSGDVYGRGRVGCELFSEDDYGWLDPTDIRSCYGESKRMAENMCVCWSKQFNVPAKIVRPFHTYGPGMKLDDGRVFADFVADVVHGRDITMKSDGAAVRAYCYLSDAVEAFFRVLLDGKVGVPYNIGNEAEQISVLDLAHLLVSMYPEKSLKVVQAEHASATGYLPSKISRACPETSRARELGWTPEIGLSEGFRRTIASFS